MTENIEKELADIRLNFQRHSDTDEASLKEIRDTLVRIEKDRIARHDEIMELLKPMSETYKTASTLGKWLMGAAVFISIMLGIILSLKSFIHK